MSSVVLLGLLWAAVGIVLAIRWWSERAQPLGHHAAGDLEAPAPVGTARFGQLIESRAEHRLQAMRLAYAAGTCLVALGFLTEASLALAFGAALVNLGTIYRHLVRLVDEAPSEEPVLRRPAHRRTRQPLVELLVGDPGR
jgi:hypothetical protein